MKILLVKLNHLGDTLLLTPTVRFLKERFPEACIDVMVRSSCEVMLQGNPDIAHLVLVSSPEKEHRSMGRTFSEFRRAARVVCNQGYDYAFDLSDSDRAKFWIALSRAKIRGINDAYNTLGWKACLFNSVSRFDWAPGHQVLRDFRTVTDIMKLKGEPGPLRFYPQIESKDWLCRLPVSEDFAVIHPASRWAFKQWLPERWAAVADSLHRECSLRVIFSCGPNNREKNLIREILSGCKEKHFNTDGQLSLHELGLLLQGARIFLGVDTAVMHLAAAMQTPTLVLFGPSAEWAWSPWLCPSELAIGECPCKRIRQFNCDKSKPYPCMTRITVESVLRLAAGLLKHSDCRCRPGVEPTV